MSVVYSATKGAVDAITGVLAKELGARKIRVNSINPGGVETEGTHQAGIVGSDSREPGNGAGHPRRTLQSPLNQSRPTDTPTRSPGWS